MLPVRSGTPVATMAIQAALRGKLSGAWAPGLRQGLQRELQRLADQVSRSQPYLPQGVSEPSAEPTGALTPPAPAPSQTKAEVSPAQHHSKRKLSRVKSLPFTRRNLAPRVYTSQEAARALCTDESTIRRKASIAWHAGDGRPQQLPGEPGWFVVGPGSAKGGRKCGWRLQREQDENAQEQSVPVKPSGGACQPENFR
jgi:hypothetical protein